MQQNYANPRADAYYAHLMAHPEEFPFAFCYGGKQYCGFGQNAFTLLHRSTRQQDDRESTTFTWQCDDTLHVTLLCTHYTTHGVTEWTVWFENPGCTDSDILQDARTALRFTGERPVLKGILGDHVNQYRPYSIALDTMPVRFTSSIGRTTHINFPYFNLEYGDGGVMLAIGWAGTWQADLRFDGRTTTYTARSINGLHTRLHPGEKIRTALFVAAPYTRRNENYATNYWRSWYINCNLPPMDAHGTPLTPFSTCCLASDTGLPNSDGSISERHFTWRPSLEKMLAEDVKVDFRWFDAGWYIAPDNTSPESDWWGTVGTWTLDENKWPGDSFLQSTEFARAHGMKTLMWFEPERVTNPEALAQNFGYDPAWAIRQEGATDISNNLGDPACYQWTLQRILHTLKENRVEMYREDNNSDPARLWRYLDSLQGPERTGITEALQIDAHYRLWDDIIACTLSYGGCGFVDSCAGGGGRNDLESMRRGIPLLRSDSDRTSTALRLSMTTAFNKWIPFCGANTKEKLSELAPTGTSDPYVWRASYLPALNVDSQFVQDPQQDFGMLRFGLAEWKKTTPYLLKDFYVLTPWHAEKDKTAFTAYSLFDAQSGKGLVLAFRQEECTEDTLNITLPYIEGGQAFTLRDEDTGETLRFAGEDMHRSGIDLTFAHARQARLLWVETENA